MTCPFNEQWNNPWSFSHSNQPLRSFYLIPIPSWITILRHCVNKNTSSDHTKQHANDGEPKASQSCSWPIFIVLWFKPDFIMIGQVLFVTFLPWPEFSSWTKKFSPRRVIAAICQHCIDIWVYTWGVSLGRDWMVATIVAKGLNTSIRGFISLLIIKDNWRSRKILSFTEFYLIIYLIDVKSFNLRWGLFSYLWLNLRIPSTAWMMQYCKLNILKCSLNTTQRGQRGCADLVQIHLTRFQKMRTCSNSWAALFNRIKWWLMKLHSSLW